MRCCLGMLGALALARGVAATTTTATTSSVDDADDTSLIGYYVGESTVQRLAAAGNWVTSGTYAGDCDSTTSCTFATKCSDNTLIFDSGESSACGTALQCVEFTIYQSSPYGTPTAHNFGCRAGWSAYTVYRENPATSTSATSTSTSSSATAAITSPPVSTTSTVVAATTSSSSSTSSGSGSGTSTGAIVGAVVGSVLGVALIGAVAFWLIRRKRGYAAAATPPSHPQNDDKYYFAGSMPQEMSGVSYRPSELHDTSNASFTPELAGPKPYGFTHELPAH